MYRENAQTKNELPWYQYSAEHKAETEESYSWIWKAINSEICKTGNQDYEVLDREITEGSGKLAFTLLGKAKRLERMVRIAKEEKKTRGFSYLDKCRSIDEGYELYMRNLFALRRIGFSGSREGWELFGELISEKTMSAFALAIIFTEEQVGCSREFLNEISKVLEKKADVHEQEIWKNISRNVRIDKK